LTLLTCPLMILTLGLFTLIVNALMLMLTAWIAGLPQLNLGFAVDGFAAAFLGALVVSIVSFVLTLLLHEDNEQHHPRR
jgi:putative membrane protein